MVKKVSSKTYDSTKYKSFIIVALNFSEAADLAFEFEYFNAAGVLYIHSAIAYSDAITIKLSGRKCSGNNHYEVIQLLESVVPKIRIDTKAFNNLKSLIDQKNLISYTGDIYHKKDLEKIIKAFKRFSEWAKSILE
ncbi:MAG TPA: hypothetical protein PKD03_14030 [Ignavibacteriaceae bacterium]|jgi:hypothetical protein|nr:hypothetical protein [Ignavibacteriaceae bacterium]